MALPDSIKARIEAEARRRGMDPAEAIAQAESRGSSATAGRDIENSDQPERPIAERLLIGFLPFIKVVELRALWLGLKDRIPDDELTCGEYQLKHGAAPSSGPAPEGDE